ncbi:MAG: hypothetical protein AB7S68_30590 [Polyangiaceae bacterium]
MLPRGKKASAWVRCGLLAVACVALAPACGRQQEEETPERVVEMFIDRMESVHGDPKMARLAYDLMWSDAQRVLTERAKRASAVVGRNLGPEEMLAPSRFSLRFEPHRFKARVEGPRAVVAVIGASPGERFDVHCVHEELGWRVVMDIPEPPPIRKRKTED